MTRIVCQQVAPRIADLQANRRLSLSAIADAAATGADVIVLPELVTSGYMFHSAEEAASVAISAEDPLFEQWAAEAGSAVVIGGFAERGDDGLIYNSAAVVDRSGVIGVYRKGHLWDREKLCFAPGGEPPRVFDTSAGRIGVLVCYDLEFPEMPRMLALAGAELICVPTNWPLVERPEGERPPEVTIGMAAARVNRVFIACCDRTGTERGQHWTAGTSILDEEGWVLASQSGAGAARASVDLSRSRDKAYTELADVIADRRPELYGPVAQPHAVAAGRPAN
ncbi:MAG: nitrilase-related carbon-nitrogen hydrolase [Solirubrobacteraceae bacterium]